MFSEYTDDHDNTLPGTACPHHIKKESIWDVWGCKPLFVFLSYKLQGLKRLLPTQHAVPMEFEFFKNIDFQSFKNFQIFVFICICNFVGNLDKI